MAELTPEEMRKLLALQEQAEGQAVANEVAEVLKQHGYAMQIVEVRVNGQLSQMQVQYVKSVQTTP